MKLLTFSMFSKSFQIRIVVTNHRFAFHLACISHLEFICISDSQRQHFRTTAWKIGASQSEDRMVWNERVWWNLPSRHGMRVCWMSLDQASSPSCPWYTVTRQLVIWIPRKSTLSRSSLPTSTKTQQVINVTSTGSRNLLQLSSSSVTLFFHWLKAKGNGNGGRLSSCLRVSEVASDWSKPYFSSCCLIRSFVDSLIKLIKNKFASFCNLFCCFAVVPYLGHLVPPDSSRSRSAPFLAPPGIKWMGIARICSFSFCPFLPFLWPSTHWDVI